MDQNDFYVLLYARENSRDISWEVEQPKIFLHFIIVDHKICNILVNASWQHVYYIAGQFKPWQVPTVVTSIMGRSVRTRFVLLNSLWDLKLHKGLSNLDFGGSCV